jgi:hypothetical protein
MSATVSDNKYRIRPESNRSDVFHVSRASLGIVSDACFLTALKPLFSLDEARRRKRRRTAAVPVSVSDTEYDTE